MNAPALHASPIAYGLRRRAVRGVLIGLAASVVMALTGAFETGSAPIGQRLAFWAAVILPGSVLGLAVAHLVRIWGGLARRKGAEIVLIAVLVSVPHTFAVIVASALFFGMGTITPMVVLDFWLAVLIVSIVLTTINSLAVAPEAAALAPADPSPAGAAAEPEPGAAPAPAPQVAALPPLPELIAEKLPARLRAGGLRAIEAEDHYLRIHTDAGSDLVLMRMGDACALLDAVPGARVHRSWWVARSAVEGRGRQAGKVVLTLAGGLTVPVSRAMQTVLREEGWG